MITTRLACGVLAAGVLATAGACTPSAERARETATSAKPPSETVRPLLTMPLPGVKGRTFTTSIVDFPPRARAVPHRHGDAFVYAYVLRGAVTSRLAGAPVRTYHQGENWVERPGAHHVLTENRSRTQPAKLLVVFVSHTGDPLKVDDAPR